LGSERSDKDPSPRPLPGGEGAGGSGPRTQQADESLARSFSLAMNASTSRWGILCDVVFSSAAAAAGALLFALALHYQKTALSVVGAVIAAGPVLTCVGANLALRGARARVVRWLASLPFPVENMNAILSCFGEEFEIHFVGEMPSRDEVMEHLARVSEDVFVLEEHEDQKLILARLGVIVNKHLSQMAGWKRYERIHRVVEEALVPLHERYPIAMVRVV